MKRVTTACCLSFCISFFAGCNTFEGIAGDPGETYTTTYNTPGLRIVPYNDPNIDAKEPTDEIQICEGLVNGHPMPRCDR